MSMVITDIELSDLMLQLDANLTTQEPIAAVIAEKRQRLNDELADFVADIQALKAVETALREDIKQSIAALGGTPYRDKATGKTASLVTTTRPAVHDTEQIRGFLRERGTLDEFLILDERAVLDLAKTVTIPGIERITSTSLRVR